MDEHKSQVRPSASMEVDGLRSLPLPGSEPFSFDMDGPSADALLLPAHSRLSPRADDGMSIGASSLGTSLPVDEKGDSEEELNEVDDAPRASYISLESEDELPPPSTLPPSPPQAHGTRQSARQAATTAAATTGSDSEGSAVDDSTQYCYCHTGWTGEMMVSCDQCLLWFHAGQSSLCTRQLAC